MYKITAKARDGQERPVFFMPETLQGCAGAMNAMTCGTRHGALVGLRGTGSYSATNSAGDMLRAEYVKGAK